MASVVCCRVLLKSPLNIFARLQTCHGWRAVSAVRQLCKFQRRTWLTVTPGLSTRYTAVLCNFAKPPLSVLGRRYGHMDMPKLTPDDVKRRVMAVCRSFEKISEEELTEDSHFLTDLGLDSLDHLEIIMAIEDEFVFEISVEDGEKLVRPTDFMKYIHENDAKVLDRELDDEYYKYW